MTYELIKLTAYEWKAMDFWKSNVNAASVNALKGLIEQHDEYAIEAGPNGQTCEYTCEMLAPIKAEINERLETILERYEDFASN